MYLVKVGDRIINLDAARAIQLHTRVLESPSGAWVDGLRVRFSDAGLSEEFSGPEAAWLRSYLSRVLADETPSE